MSGEHKAVELASKKKIEFIVPTPMVRHVIEGLDDHGAHRYTIVDAVAGRGHSRDWDQTQLTDATQHAMIVVIVSEDRVEPLLEYIRGFFGEYQGIVAVSDVQVMRSDYF